MKKGLSYLLLTVSMLTISNTDLDARQFEAIFHVETGSCSTGDCEVKTRQYTGIFGSRYVINVRCMDSAGNFGSWETWEYSGINPGTYCGT